MWLVGSSIAAIITLGALVKSFKDIRTDGWEEFRDRWITPRRARRQRNEKLFESVGDLQKTCEALTETCGVIRSELMTNGGGSIKDTVNIIHRKVEHIQARVKHQDETSSIPTIEFDQGAGITFANCAFRELVNADLSELHHRNYLSRVHPDDRTRLIKELQEAVDNKMPIDSTVRFRIAQNQYVLVHLEALPDVRPGGDLMGYFGTASKVPIASE